MKQLVDRYGRTIEKTILAQSNEINFSNKKPPQNKRGMTIYSTAQLQRVTGRDKEGRLLSWGMEHPYFYLTIDQRIEIMRLSAPVWGVVTSRMHRISGLNFNIISESKKEEERAEEMKDYYAIYNEYKESTALAHLSLRAKIYQELIKNLPDLKPDLSNFQPSLLRWKRRQKKVSLMSCDNAMNWLREPNNGVPWTDFCKKWVMDYMIHGCASIYKNIENNRLENFDMLPGGTVYPIKAPYFSGVSGYVQILPGFPGYSANMEPQIFFGDEVVYSVYVPTSSRNYGFIPLEALINKIAESLLFDKLMADQADGTKPPEKLVIITDNNPWGSMDSGADQDMPLDMDEQARIEEKINTPVKNSVMTFSGNSAQVVDLSRENTMGIQMQRQKDIREETALVFNMSNLEINLTGSDNTSGRSTSEAQAEIEQGKGIAPIAGTLSESITKGILPYRFGPGMVFEFDKGKNEREEKELDVISLQTGEMTKNEIREKYNKSSFGPEYDTPDGGGGQGAPGEDQFNPLFTKNVEK